MLRTSSYTIYVDLENNDQEMLLVHGYTGAYDKVSRSIASFLKSKELCRAPRPLYGDWSNDSVGPDPAAEYPGDKALEILQKRGYLTSRSLEEEEQFFENLVNHLHRLEQVERPTYIVMPTYDCNLRCTYCFQDHMRTDKKYRYLLKTITPEMIDRICGAMQQLEQMHKIEGSQKKNIGLFGGEPLLATHRPILEYMTRKFGDADYWAVTNGTEIDQLADLLGPGAIATLQITLDGPETEHDQRRVRADGSGTFKKIAENIDMALGLGAKIQIRMNIDRNNIDRLPNLACEFIERGWTDNPLFSAYTAPITPSNPQTERKTTFNTWELDQALQELQATSPELEVISRPDEGIRARAAKIFRRQEQTAPQLKPSFCSAHSKMYIFDPLGDVYTCWEKTGDAKIRIARIDDDGIRFHHEQNRRWRSRTVATNPACRKCRYALHCGGGCAVLALGKTGRLHSNYCDGFASRFRASIAEAYTDTLSGIAPRAHQEMVCDL